MRVIKSPRAGGERQEGGGVELHTKAASPEASGAATVDPAMGHGLWPGHGASHSVGEEKTGARVWGGGS